MNRRIAPTYQQTLFTTLSCLLLVMIMSGCPEQHPEPKTPPPPPENSIKNIQYSIVARLPHDTNSFTEGLLFHNNQLWESTGATPQLPQTRSLFGNVDLKTGVINVRAEIDKDIYFGEGICFLNNKVYQLTYRNKKGFVFDAKSFAQVGEFSFPSQEGWGMTTDGQALIMSDGTSTLTWLDPEDFHVIKTLQISEQGYDRDRINELEWVDGFIYANIWTSSLIVKIDPNTAKVVAKLDLSALENEVRGKYAEAAEMNGIAFNPQTKTFVVTGKMWPTMYELKLD